MSQSSNFISWLSAPKPCYLPGLGEKDYVFYTQVKHFNVKYTADSGAFVYGLSYYMDKKVKKVKDVVRIHVFFEDPNASNPTARFRAVIELFKRVDNLGKVVRDRKFKLHQDFDIIEVPNLNLFNIPIEKLQGVCHIIFGTPRDDPISLIQAHLLTDNPIYVCRFTLDSLNDKKMLKCVMENMYSGTKRNKEAQRIDLNNTVMSVDKNNSRVEISDTNIEKLFDITSFEYENSSIRLTLEPKNVSYLKNVPKTDFNNLSLSEILINNLDNQNEFNLTIDKETQTPRSCLNDNFSEDLNSTSIIKNRKGRNWKEIAEKVDKIARKELNNNILEITPKNILQKNEDSLSSEFETDYNSTNNKSTNEIKSFKSKRSQKYSSNHLNQKSGIVNVKKSRKKLFSDKNLYNSIDEQNKNICIQLKNSSKDSKQSKKYSDRNSEIVNVKNPRRKMFLDKNLYNYSIPETNTDICENNQVENSTKNSKRSKNNDKNSATVKSFPKKLISGKKHSIDRRNEDILEIEHLKKSPKFSKQKKDFSKNFINVSDGFSTTISESTAKNIKTPQKRSSSEKLKGEKSTKSPKKKFCLENFVKKNSVQKNSVQKTDISGLDSNCDSDCNLDEIQAEIQSDTNESIPFENSSKRKNEKSLKSTSKPELNCSTTQIVDETAQMDQEKATFQSKYNDFISLKNIEKRKNENVFESTLKPKLKCNSTHIVSKTTKFDHKKDTLQSKKPNNNSISCTNFEKRKNENVYELNSIKNNNKSECILKTSDNNTDNLQVDLSLEEIKFDLLTFYQNLAKRKNKETNFSKKIENNSITCPIESKYEQKYANKCIENTNSNEIHTNLTKHQNENSHEGIVNQTKTGDDLKLLQENNCESNHENSCLLMKIPKKHNLSVEDTSKKYNKHYFDSVPPKLGPKKEIFTELSNNGELIFICQKKFDKKKVRKISQIESSNFFPVVQIDSLPSKTIPVAQIESRTTHLAPLNEFELARSCLNNIESLTCRGAEFDSIVGFISEKLVDNKGGCMYISGIPGTGKTETVSEVRRYFDGTNVKVIYVNALALAEPRQIYVEIVRQMSGQVLTCDEAPSYINMYFSKPNNLVHVLIIDELDKLCTRNQDVIHNLLNLLSISQSPVIILAIANMADLPEMLFDQKVRLDLVRLNFQPYTHQELFKIVENRLKDCKGLFKNDALEYICRKVAALSGDARRAITICNRALEIAETSGENIVTMDTINKTFTDINNSPKIEAIKSCSKTEKIILQALVSETSRTGNDEVPIYNLIQIVEKICIFLSINVPNAYMLLKCCRKLNYFCLIVVEDGLHDVSSKVLLNVSSYDIKLALKDVYE